MFRLRIPALCIAVLSASALAAAGCGGGQPTGHAAATTATTIPAASSSGPPAPLPLWQRVLESGELAGFQSGANPPKEIGLDAFVDQSHVAFIRITPQQARDELTADGFKRALISDLSLPGNKDVIAASVVLQLGSDAQARRASAFFGADSLKACRNTCNVNISSFDLPDVGATGSHRSRPALAAGAGSDQPFEAFDVGFADGPFLYDVFVLTPRPGMVSQQAVAAAVRALYERVRSSPPLPAGPPA
jgi:hypothetical protein